METDSTGVLAWTLGSHAMILPLALIAFHKYGDRTEIFSKALADTDSLLASMRKRVVTAFEEGLSDTFYRAGSDPILISPDLYTERPVNPVGSDDFRQSLSGIIDGNADILVDYMRTSRARKLWCFWARILSWTVLIAAIWQVICVAGLGLGVKLLAFNVPIYWVKWSFGPTTVLVSLFFICQVAMLLHHDVIQESKGQYNVF